MNTKKNNLNLFIESISFLSFEIDLLAKIIRIKLITAEDKIL